MSGAGRRRVQDAVGTGEPAARRGDPARDQVLARDPHGDARSAAAIAVARVGGERALAQREALVDVAEEPHARSGAVNIACQVIGDGPVDLLYIPGVGLDAGGTGSVADEIRGALGARGVRAGLAASARSERQPATLARSPGMHA